MRLRFFQFVMLGAIMLMTADGVAQNSCYECKKNCNNAEDQCKDAGGPLCDLKPLGPVCDLYENFQCPLTKKYCLEVNCGTMPDCDPNPMPKPKGKGGGGLSGEPHFRTLDQGRYDLQPIGEFVLARHKDLEVQARIKRYTDSTSVASVVAVRAGGRVIVAYQDGRVTIDGVVTQVPEYGLLLADDAFLLRPKEKTLVLSAGGHGLEIWQHLGAMSVRLVPAAKPDGTWVGLLGDYDGDPKNDFKDRDGTVYDSSAMTREVLYDKFAKSWRLTQDESILPYESGQTTETFTDLAFPKKVFLVSELDEKSFMGAHETCVAGGVRPGEKLQNCIYDVAATGAKEFVEHYLGPSYWSRLVVTVLGSKMSIRAPSQGVQGRSVPVYWTRTKIGKGVVNLVTMTGKTLRSAGLTFGSPIPIPLPTVPGSYKVEFVQGDERVEQTIEVTAAKVSITAPERVEGAQPFTVTWTGPNGNLDWVALGAPGAEKPRPYLVYEWARRGTATFKAPAQAGTYEIRYVLQGGLGDSIIARTKVVVAGATASIAGPGDVVAGSKFEVTWTGPGGNGDYIDLTNKAELLEPRGYVTYRYAKKGLETVVIHAPIKAGKYALRYIVTTPGRESVLAVRPFVVTAPTVKVVAPDTVVAKEKFEVTVTGLDGRHHWVTVAKKGETNPRKYTTYAWKTADTITLKAPVEPGQYQVNAILQGPGKAKVAASAAFTVTAPR